jgi:hypothetical protein
MTGGSRLSLGESKRALGGPLLAGGARGVDWAAELRETR